MNDGFPSTIPNLIAGRETPSAAADHFEKVCPHDGSVLTRAARSGAEDVAKAVQAAKVAQLDWAGRTGVDRGGILHSLAMAMRQNREWISRIVAAETGKSLKLSLGETDGSVALGLFMAGEGQRLYGRTTTSGMVNRCAMTVREPIGIAGLIVPANTPLPNIAWKVIPALVCGNAAVLKSAEDAPATAWAFGRIAVEAGIPPGIINIIHGYGSEAGAALVENPDVNAISFTGSTNVGREIARKAGNRLARVSLELGGKNPLVVCDDADLENAAKWVLLSAFSNAGQRCAAGSRIIIFDSIYDRFRDELVKRTESLRIGVTDEDDLGPVINERQLNAMLSVVEGARREGGTVLTGGYRMDGAAHRSGFYVVPTLLENVDPKSEISTRELFGPIACLYRVRDFSEALLLANCSPYGLTACIHTRNLHRAFEFTKKVQTGVAIVNAGTFGSEPHMPFGGRKQSGNGWREPGTEALDFYSELKDIYINIDPGQA